MTFLARAGRKLLLFFLSLLSPLQPPLLPSEAADSPRFLSGLCCSPLSTVRVHTHTYTLTISLPPPPPAPEEVRAGWDVPWSCSAGRLGSAPPAARAQLAAPGLPPRQAPHVWPHRLCSVQGVLAQGTSGSQGGAAPAQRKRDLWLICTRRSDKWSLPLVHSPPSLPGHLHVEGSVFSQTVCPITS